MKQELNAERMDILNGKESFWSCHRHLMAYQCLEKVKMNPTFFSLTISEAVRTRYRIAKYRYEIFYKERIQSTLAACIYNEGRRTPKSRTVREMNEAIQNQASTMNQQSMTTVIDDWYDEQ